MKTQRFTCDCVGWCLCDVPDFGVASLHKLIESWIDDLEMARAYLHSDMSPASGILEDVIDEMRGAKPKETQK